MKILILTNHGNTMKGLNDLTSPNKEAYCKLHGYDYINKSWRYDNHVQWLRLIAQKIEQYDVVMTMGCDTIFTNTRLKIEHLWANLPVNLLANIVAPEKALERDSRVLIAREHLREWPINNDVMLWPRSDQSRRLLHTLIEDEPIWIKYRWIWQHHMWNLMQKNAEIANCVRVVEARVMNSTFQPFVVGGDKLTRMPGPSSWQIGDWILHALDLPYEMRMQVIKWGLGFVGDGSWIPKENVDAQDQVN